MYADDSALFATKLDNLLTRARAWQQASVRQQTPPSMILEILSDDAGVGAGVRFGDLQNNVRMRVTNILGMVGANSTILTLFVGLRTYRYGCSGTVRTLRGPFPIILDAGVDIAATSSAASAKVTGFYIIGYPEGN